MKILVLSDSHAGISFMKYAISHIKPDAVIHLGDYFEDGALLIELFPTIRLHQVPGNCDKYRMIGIHPETLCYHVCGVKLYMTHGHKYHVKSSIYSLIRDAESADADAVLYGHTHIADCHKEESGIWVLNPGACGSYSGSVGVIEVINNKIASCRILRQEDLEAYV